MNDGITNRVPTAAYTHTSQPAQQPAALSNPLEGKAWRSGFFSADARELRPQQTASAAAQNRMPDALPTPHNLENLSVPLGFFRHWHQSMEAGYAGFVNPSSSEPRLPQAADSNAPVEDGAPDAAASTPSSAKPPENLVLLFGPNFPT